MSEHQRQAQLAPTTIQKLELAGQIVETVDGELARRGIEITGNCAEILYLALCAECTDVERERYGISGRK